MEKKTALSGEIDKNQSKEKLLDFLYKFLPTIVDRNYGQTGMYPGLLMSQNIVYIGHQNLQILIEKIIDDDAFPTYL